MAGNDAYQRPIIISNDAIDGLFNKVKLDHTKIRLSNLC